MPDHGYHRSELAVLSRLKTPEDIQRFLDEKIRYNKEPDGATCRSPRMVLRDRLAHCMEGALFGAAALEHLGYPPLLVDMEAVRDDDHVVAVFRRNGCWGAVAKSNYSGLRFRTPVYRTVRELVMSYFEHYYNPAGEKTLRGYSRPIRLTQFNNLGWRTAEDHVWDIPAHLATLPHFPILKSPPRRRLLMDRRLYEAGYWGAVR